MLGDRYSYLWKLRLTNSGYDADELMHRLKRAKNEKYALKQKVEVLQRRLEESASARESIVPAPFANSQVKPFMNHIQSRNGMLWFC